MNIKIELDLLKYIIFDTELLSRRLFSITVRARLNDACKCGYNFLNKSKSNVLFHTDYAFHAFSNVIFSLGGTHFYPVQNETSSFVPQSISLITLHMIHKLRYVHSRKQKKILLEYSFHCQDIQS